MCITATQNKRELVLRQNTEKTYQFDRVFGPEASQETVFDEVVSGMLTEVLMGYNCTIFAYGQTGTGKTHTMEGDLDNQFEMGVIPRCLFTLFNTLDGDSVEYSVRVSFMELYNEELKDLLCPIDSGAKLKVFEDLGRKGSVVIQGLEETLVKNAQDAIEVMHRGAAKRQTASTKMNQASSRSHAIMTITVHIKECTADGEELLKVGKLNLVDLAGSENIGRSGAEHKRAKEAGMINQSLLTLGRVINALVERSPHVPYRESKLTRILQDSLGGRTKTCIIACCSPARCNMEESLSTLDYAHRAKNIRNKPEANQRMTKKALIREYINEIERLKADLNATRDKNGVYMATDSYNLLMSESQSRRDELIEAAAAVKMKEEQLAQSEVRFKANVALLDQTNDQLRALEAELDLKRSDLNAALASVEQTRVKLLEQTYLTDAHAKTEQKLDRIAGSLVDTLTASIQDVTGLHDKLDNKRRLEKQNMSMFSDFQAHLGSMLEDASHRIDEFSSEFAAARSSASSALAQSVASIDDGVKVHLDNVVTSIGLLDKHLQNTEALANAGRTQIEGFATNHSNIYSQLLQSINGFASHVSIGLSSLKQRVSDETVEHKMKLHEIQTNLKSNTSSLFDQIRAFTTSALKRQLQDHNTVTGQLKKQIASLKALQNQTEAQRDNTRASLRSSIADFLDTLSTHASKLQTQLEEAHDASCSTVMNAIEISANESLQVVSRCDERLVVETARLERLCDDVSAYSGTIGSLFVQQDAQIDSTATEASETVSTAATAIISSTEAQAREALKTADDYEQAVRGFSGAMRRDHDKVVEDATNAIGIAVNSLTSSMHNLQESVQAQTSIQTTTITALPTITDAVEKYTTDLEGSIGQARGLVDEANLVGDEVTGKTPMRRSMRFTSHWSTTKSHDELLAEYHKRRDLENDDALEPSGDTKRARIQRDSFGFVGDVGCLVDDSDAGCLGSRDDGVSEVGDGGSSGESGKQGDENSESCSGVSAGDASKLPRRSGRRKGASSSQQRVAFSTINE